MVAVLAAEFGVSIPRIICHGRHSTQAFYRYWVNEIHFVGVESQEEWAVIHEFAHHLTRMTFPRQKLYTNSGRGKHHGPEFMESLERCILAWYGNMSSYSWQKEYRSIFKAAAKREYVNNPDILKRVDNKRFQVVVEDGDEVVWTKKYANYNYAVSVARNRKRENPDFDVRVEWDKIF